MSARIVFLDFDGVVNCSMPPEGQETFVVWDGRRHDLYPYLVARVDEIADPVGAEVVIHSSWRHVYESEDLVGMLRSAGLRAPCRGAIEPRDETMSRGNAVRDWLTRHPSVVDYVILDDYSERMFLYEDRPRLVRTSPVTGLTEDNVRDALHILRHGVRRG